MKTIPITDDSIYHGAGWAVAAIVGETLIAARYIDHPDMPAEQLRAAVDELRAEPAVIAALAEDDRAYERAEALMEDDPEAAAAAETEWAETVAVAIRGGMMSSREFCFLFSARERAEIGIRHPWF